MSENELAKLVGRNIQSVRLSKNISLKEISEKTKIRVEYLKKIERGEADRFNTNHFFVIAEALDTPAWKLAR